MPLIFPKFSLFYKNILPGAKVQFVTSKGRDKNFEKLDTDKNPSTDNSNSENQDASEKWSAWRNRKYKKKTEINLVAKKLKKKLPKHTAWSFFRLLFMYQVFPGKIVYGLFDLGENGDEG